MTVEEVREHRAGVYYYSAAFSARAEGATSLLRSQDLEVWEDMSTRRREWWPIEEVLARGSMKGRDREVSALGFSPDGGTLAVGTAEGVVGLFDTATWRRLARCTGHATTVAHVDWSRDSSTVQTNCRGYEILYWEGRSGRQLLGAHRDWEAWEGWSCVLGWPVMGIWRDGYDGTDINAVHASDDGRLLVAADDRGGVLLYRVPCAARRAPGRRFRAHSSHVMNVRWLAGGDRCVSVGGRDRAHEPRGPAWEATKPLLTLRRVRTLHGTPGMVGTLVSLHERLGEIDAAAGCFEGVGDVGSEHEADADVVGDEHAERSQLELDLPVSAYNAAQRGLFRELFARGEFLHLNPNAQFDHNLTSKLGNAIGVKALTLLDLCLQVALVDDIVKGHRFFQPGSDVALRHAGRLRGENVQSGEHWARSEGIFSARGPWG